MSKDDWYRNSKWNSKIEKAFNEKLNRSRRKEQYLRIQASYLTSKHPKVSLKLLDEYFMLEDKFDNAQAYVDQANAYIALDNIEEAICSYEKALEREKIFANLLTEAYIEYPFFVAINNLSIYYDRVLEILKDSNDRLSFAVDYFRYHSSLAIILKSNGYLDEARDNAKEAIMYSEKDHSGFSYHKNIGLVDKEYKKAIKKISKILK